MIDFGLIFGTNGKEIRISVSNLKNCIDNFEDSYTLTRDNGNPSQLVFLELNTILFQTYSIKIINPKNEI